MYVSYSVPRIDNRLHECALCSNYDIGLTSRPLKPMMKLMKQMELTKLTKSNR